MVVLVGVIQSLRACDWSGVSQSITGQHDEPMPTTKTCPSRIAARLPQSTNTELVAAYRTPDKQIVLCRLGSGAVYYYGEYTDRPTTGIAMAAAPTATGYVARNGAYQYEIKGDKVIVTHNGKVIGNDTLTPELAAS